MSDYNTGPIIERRVCEFTGEVEIARKATMYDVARKREREVIAKRKLARIDAAADAPCAGS